MEKNEKPVWFVTGSGTGAGQAIVAHAISQGHRVVTTALQRSEVEVLEKEHPGQALALELNVNNAQQCADTIDQATDQFGRVDVLVNAAGYPYFAALEEGVDADARRLMETLFWGPVNLIKAVLPQMRARRSGHIINYSSIGGFAGFPGNSYYCAAKHAIEGMSKSLHTEVKPLGINVTIIEPGNFHGGFMRVNRRHSDVDIEDYAETAGVFKQVPEDVRLEGDPVRAAKVIFDIVNQADPPLVLPLGKLGYELSISSHIELLANAQRLKELTLGVDFPEGQHPLDQ